MAQVLKKCLVKSINGRLLYLIGRRGLVFKNMSFIDVDLETGNTSVIVSLPVNAKTRLFSRIRLLNRIMRLEPRCAGRLDEHLFIVNVVGKVWLLDVQKKEVRVLLNLREGFSVLNFCEKDGSVYWGDYGVNPDYDEINIYRLDGDLKLSVVYSFPKGDIRHIHNIIKDSDEFVVLAGDNEPQAGIYRFNSDWSEVKPWKIGQQKYRAVVAFPCNGGLLYATDSVETENHIRFISANGEESILSSLNGSCIYGCETHNDYIFSTTVEPHEGGGKLALFSNKLGGGIKSREVTMVAVSKKDLSVRQVASFKKDGWPMKLFQYGRCIFAEGQENANSVWCSPAACRHYDGKTIRIDI